jgi:SAM-dependent methyltransferase
LGVNIISARFLLHARRTGANFAHTAVLGRQQMNLEARELHWMMKDNEFLVPYSDAQRFVAATHADSFLRFLGAETLATFDASDYEGADVVFDFNGAIPHRFHDSFTVVLDSGTLEHIFNFPQAVANCMRMLKVGGYFLGVMPANNLLGHGFYQFSPELLFRVFCEQNGFEMQEMILAEQADEPPFRCASWVQLVDPAVVGSRVEFRTARQSCLLVMAKKTKAVPLFASDVQQSDYVTAWRGKVSA